MSDPVVPASSFPSIAKKLLRRAQLGVVVVATLFLIGWAVGPIREPMKRLGLFDDSSVGAIVALLVTLIVAMLNELSERTNAVGNALAVRDRELLNRTERIDRALSLLEPPQSALIQDGNTKVYPQLLDELQRVPENARTLDVFGLHLTTAWPQLQGWLAQPETGHGWRIRMVCLSPELERRGLPWIRDEWYGFARAALQQIRGYLVKHDASLKSRNIRLTLDTYDCVPALHGFLLGNGSLFISCLRWETETDTLDEPHFFYERFDSLDRSDRADAYRALFANWFEHAIRTSRQTRSEAAIPPGGDSGSR
jgi:hypothetical protein